MFDLVLFIYLIAKKKKSAQFFVLSYCVLVMYIQKSLPTALLQMCGGVFRFFTILEIKKA